jgi:hypothetical protein
MVGGGSVEERGSWYFSMAPKVPKVVSDVVMLSLASLKLAESGVGVEAPHVHLTESIFRSFRLRCTTMVSLVVVAQQKETKHKNLRSL